ncbi:ABC transporter permease [Arcanobacterium ihumii]|uniref:ABC transporter permease n=1 Tax=Arcanobacterium ihumii TaxID=2138162 RepID=UPI000F532D9C|nr:ABC transporter permease [Arcanobacterium ihumii]
MARTVLMISAVALSTGALLASVGIAQNAAHQVDADIAASTINQVLVKPAEKAVPPQSPEDVQAGKIQRFLPADAEARLHTIHTVEAAGRKLTVPAGSPVGKIGRPLAKVEEARLELAGVNEEYLDAAEIKKPALAWMLNGTQPVAFLGPDAAKLLQIPETNRLEGLTIRIGNEDYSVGGFIHGPDGSSNDVYIPFENGLNLTKTDKECEILIRTKIGAGSQVSNAARLAIMPQAPEKLAVSQVASVQKIRESVSGQLARQAAWVGAFLIVLTILLIANSMIVSVTARTTEIGVRRALGSSRSKVAAVFWIEGALTGALGGLIGSAVSACIMVLVAAISDWTAHLNPRWIALGPLLGAGVGIIASAYPAIRASAIHPAIAVRSD